MRGYTLLETVVYVGILAVIAVLALGSILSVYKAFGKIKIERKLALNGDVATERMLREIRSATSTDTSVSVFGVHPGILKVSATKFSLSGSTLNGASLVGQWKFDEGSGTTASDSSGNNNTGTLVNGPTWTTGKIGQALSFDGIDDYVNIAAGGPSGTNISAAMWMKTTTAIQSALIVFGTDTPNRDFFRAEVHEGFPNGVANAIGLRYGGGRYAFDAGSGTFDGNWHHIVFVFSGPNVQNLAVYVDGVQKTTVADSFNPTLPASIGVGNTIGIGAVIIDGSYEYFNGSIDDVRVYNRALSATEIQQIYNNEEAVILQVTKNGEAPQDLTSDVSVSNLVFYRAISANSEIIKIEMTLRAGTGIFQKSKNFYGSAVLRGVY